MPIVEKWDKTLAVRIPKALVRELGFREGDHVDLHADDSGLAISQKTRPEGGLGEPHMELPTDDGFSTTFQKVRGTVDSDIDLEP